MSGDDKVSVSQTENVYDKPRRGKIVNHCKRFWWVHLIVCICVIVLAVCLVIFVGVPKIAQSKLDAADLSIDGIVVTNTQSQNFSMAINSTIRTDGSVHANIDGFVGDMYLEDLQPHTPFASITFPATTSEALQVVNVSQFIPIENMAAFTTFNTWLQNNDSLRVTVSGNTYVHVSGISKAFPVTFIKTVTMPGLRGFNGTTVTDSAISLTPDANGDNFKGFVTIPNYSIVTFEIGNASFHNYLLGEEIGTVYVDNIVLRPGIAVNNFSMHANISQGPVLTALGDKPYCQNGGVIPFQLRGKTVVNHGQPLSYYADALATANQTVELPIGGDLKALNLVIPCGGLGGSSSSSSTSSAASSSSTSH
ncbi:hypothetical protein QBC46DRAFT_356137 [Diplogelasinospora grovesii]|uniref:Uncharacterized protein n=1 Tax=Diplogelasinospora grovesii TaxID=303347 RepID=A0AAN6S2G0_9PEZI|nr:hypothetical protein QBC46DRAFT_356137 [Diplogelasinospora grovesii]